MNKLDISVVIPLYNEAESLPELCSWIEKVMKEHNYSFEVILINDGSTDESWEVISEINSKNPAFKGLRFRRNYGKSAGLSEGFKYALGDVIITMDADLQDSPDEIPKLYSKIVDEEFDLVSGWKKKRYDPITKTLPTKLFNWATRRMSGIQLNDFNCGLKAYKSDVVKSIEVYGEMHRYIPVIAKTAGFTKIGEQVVEHRSRKYGVTKFGIERFINGFLDLMSIFFVGRFGKRPMHFFGSLGILTFIFGFLIATYLVATKFLFEVYYPMTERPLFYAAIVAMIIGTQLFLAGFLGELIARSSPYKNTYTVADSLGVDIDE
jgi:glycosyltransferase involved in cell wall biosynthesis